MGKPHLDEVSSTNVSLFLSFCSLRDTQVAVFAQLQVAQLQDASG